MPKTRFVCEGFINDSGKRQCVLQFTSTRYATSTESGQPRPIGGLLVKGGINPATAFALLALRSTFKGPPAKSGVHFSDAGPSFCPSYA